MTVSLKADRIERLAKIAGMIGSAHDGEVAAAARKLIEALASDGLTLSELVRGYRPQTVSPPSTAYAATARDFYRDPAEFRRKEPRHRAHVDSCLAAIELSEWEHDFLISIRSAPTLSDKQKAILARLYNRALDTVAA